jgi:hypothetical protein
MRVQLSVFLVSPLLLAAVMTTSRAALAQDPVSKPQPPAASAAPLPPPTSAQPTIVTPAPNQAAAAAPAPSAVPITATCQLGEHPGVDDAEARTGADVLCHELAKARATDGQHEIRFGKLGGRTLVTLASRNGNAYDERRAFISGMDEIHTASPRLVSALVENKSFEDTKNVDNVISSETQPAKVQRGSMGMEGGLFGTTAIGAPANASGGVALGLVYRAERFAVSGTGRAGGIGSGDSKIGLASLDLGARYYITASETAPFLGGGFVLGYYKLNREEPGVRDIEGSGVGAYAHGGIEFLRTHHTAFNIAARMDMPFYALKTASKSESHYVMPLSLNVGVVFH